MALVRRDPKTGEELHSKSTEEEGKCKWCKSLTKLNRYWIKYPDKRVFEIPHYYCCKSCMTSYTGVE